MWRTTIRHSELCLTRMEIRYQLFHTGIGMSEFDKQNEVPLWCYSIQLWTTISLSPGCQGLQRMCRPCGNGKSFIQRSWKTEQIGLSFSSLKTMWAGQNTSMLHKTLAQQVHQFQLLETKHSLQHRTGMDPDSIMLENYNVSNFLPEGNSVFL